MGSAKGSPLGRKSAGSKQREMEVLSSDDSSVVLEVSKPRVDHGCGRTRKELPSVVDLEESPPHQEISSPNDLEDEIHVQSGAVDGLDLASPSDFEGARRLLGGKVIRKFLLIC